MHHTGAVLQVLDCHSFLGSKSVSTWLYDKAILFRVYIRAPDFWKLPHEGPNLFRPLSSHVPSVWKMQLLDLFVRAVKWPSYYRYQDSTQLAMRSHVKDPYRGSVNPLWTEGSAPRDLEKGRVLA